MSDSSFTLDLQDAVQRLRGLPSPVFRMTGHGVDDLTEDVVASIYERLASVSSDVDKERANRIRLANAVVSLAENLKRPGKSNTTDYAYYTALIDAIADLTK